LLKSWCRQRIIDKKLIVTYKTFST